MYRYYKDINLNFEQSVSTGSSQSEDSASTVDSLFERTKISTKYGFEIGEFSFYPNGISVKSIFDVVFSEQMTKFSCSDCGLVSLPEIEHLNSLKILQCSRNNLVNLPTLPPNLEELYCYLNELTELPELPLSLIFLWCDNNKLTSLPDLPSSIRSLDFSVTPYHDHLQQVYVFFFHKTDILLYQHNEKRKCLELPIVEVLTDDTQIREKWQMWKYRIGGEKYLMSEAIR